MGITIVSSDNSVNYHLVPETESYGCPMFFLQDYWQTAKKKAALEYGINTDFTFHNLKAKGISDYEGTMADKQRFSGHKEFAQVNTYDRKVDMVPPLNLKSINQPKSDK